jgi:endonuclease/exonuclease/phosphatase family metal-dependent hydrolase
MIDLRRGELQPGAVGRQPRDAFRILSWNIERGLRFQEVLDFLRTVEADLLLLQEVDLNARRTRYRDVACDLAQALNLNYAFGMEFQELSEGTSSRPAFHGMATLSPWPLSKARIIRFRDQSTFWKPRWYVPDLPAFQRRIGGRIALAAEAEIRGSKVVTYNLHLESRGDDALRLKQLNEVLADCRKYAGRPKFVIAGDFNLNAGNGDAATALREAGFRDAVRLPEHPTTVAHGFSRHAHVIDWIFTSDMLPYQGHVYEEVRASDHYPVSATLPLAAG